MTPNETARTYTAAGEPTIAQDYDVTPTYERPGSGVIVVGETLCVTAENEDAARDFIAGHLIAARLTPIRIDVRRALAPAAGEGNRA